MKGGEGAGGKGTYNAMDKQKYAFNVRKICKEETTWGRLAVDVWLCLN